MRLRAWAETNDFRHGFRVHPNKWLIRQFAEVKIVRNLELRHDYTEKVVKMPPILLTNVRLGREPNRELYQEYSYVAERPAVVKQNDDKKSSNQSK